jgi:two-component system sensor histidine kinase/response regulator
MTNQDTILVVDDNPVQSKLALHFLRRTGYDVLIATSGEEALEQVRDIRPDLILLDVLMPGIDGFETCRRLKDGEETRDIPVIFMTSLSDTADKVKGFEFGAVDYVTKPIQPQELLARINTHLTIRNLQKSLQQEIVEREKLIAELDAFAHTVAHDLKSPLTSIVGYANVLEEHHAAISGDDLLRYLQVIAQNGYRMGNIIDELLLLASVRAMEDVEIKPLDMAAIVSEARGRLAYMIEEYEAEIDLPESWPVARGYGPWVEEVWANYLSNAFKYGGRPPHVELGATERIDGGPDGFEVVRFYVRDNGDGLTPGEQERLFTPFERLDQVKAMGHGLGLSIVGRIMRKLQGQVGVESEVGVGSTFWFSLPA